MEYNKVQMYSHDNKTNFVVDGVRLMHVRSFNVKRNAEYSKSTLEIVLECDLETKEQPTAVPCSEQSYI